MLSDIAGGPVRVFRKRTIKKFVITLCNRLTFSSFFYYLLHISEHIWDLELQVRITLYHTGTQVGPGNTDIRVRHQVDVVLHFVVVFTIDGDDVVIA